MNRNHKQYKCCTFWNNGQVVWIFHWRYGHEEWENKQGNKTYISFSNPATNEVIYCSYLMNISEDSTEEENGGDDIQRNDFISLSHF